MYLFIYYFRLSRPSNWWRDVRTMRLSWEHRRAIVHYFGTRHLCAIEVTSAARRQISYSCQSAAGISTQHACNDLLSSLCSLLFSASSSPSFFFLFFFFSFFFFLSMPSFCYVIFPFSGQLSLCVCLLRCVIIATYIIHWDHSPNPNPNIKNKNTLKKWKK